MFVHKKYYSYEYDIIDIHIMYMNAEHKWSMYRIYII